ncbi:MAG TPA: DUF2344 domain-containing protein [Armatimonadota bacterium]|nr:DUF2344 domain-containing protein [Armatimonadota bacterium]
MQRIVCRYRMEAAAGSPGQSELRAHFRGAADAAGLALSDGRGVLLGPALPPDATSDAERLVLEFSAPRDPADVCRRLNAHLPPGVVIENAWVGRPGGTEENPVLLDEAVYDVRWHDAPPAQTSLARIRAFLQASSVALTRVREKKVQHLDARALTRELRVVALRDGMLHLRMTLSVGPRGSLRPAEALQALGFTPAPGALQIQRIALRSSDRQRPASQPAAARWRGAHRPR